MALDPGQEGSARVSAFGGAHIVTLNGAPGPHVGASLRKLVGLGSNGSLGLVVDLRGLTELDAGVVGDLLEVAGRLPADRSVLVFERPRMRKSVSDVGLGDVFLSAISLRRALELLDVPLAPEPPA
jgi:hypothetical protein